MTGIAAGRIVTVVADKRLHGLNRIFQNESES